MRDLAADSQAIAVVDVIPGSAKEVPADENAESTFPATSVLTAPVAIIKGKLPDPVAVRLITSPNEGSEVPPPLKEGRRYLLFLTPFEWQPGVATSEWTVPGGAGIYEITEDDGLKLRSRGADAVPAELKSISALQQELGN